MQMPTPIQRYIDATNAHDWAKLAGCFSFKAVVQDEGETHAGRAEIGMWARASMQKYEMEMRPISLREGASLIVLVAMVEGNFPGSPAEITFQFQLKGDEISSLTIG